MTHLPASRIKTIMRSTADVEMISKESTQILTRAAELFVRTLSTEGYKDTNLGKKLDYKNLANAVHSHDRYEFLREIMPKKITVREYRELLEKKQQVNGTDEAVSEEGSSSDSDSDSDDKNEGSSSD